MRIYKILPPAEMQALDASGETSGAPVDLADGFIHFSTAAQLGETLARHFAGASPLVLLAYEADDLGDALKWEPSRGGDLFPHLYAPLRRDQALWAKAIIHDGQAHVLPDGVA
mgnify:FL=1